MKLLYALIIALIFAGCRTINPDEQEPAFIYIDQIDLVTTPSQGSNSHNISEVWVYANDDILGVFDIPAQIPVLRTGQTKISVFGGIKNNGLSTQRIRYPFYASFTSTLDLQPLTDYHLEPSFNYSNGSEIDNRRNFETSNYFVNAPNNQASFNVILNPDLAVNGQKFGLAELDSGEEYLHFIDDLELGITPGEVAFLEMDYSCDNSFTIGVYVVQDGNTEKYPVLTLVPTTNTTGLNPTWNKVYLDLGGIASSYPNGDLFKFYFEAIASESTTPTIMLDNIKVVY